MCDQDAKKPLGRVFAAPLPLDDSARSRSRRRRLWELPANAHCPVIGVCMPLGLLRRLVNKGVRGTALADDYEIHVGAIGECGARSRVSELLGEALDLRYSVVIHRFRDARDADAVLALWQEAVRAGARGRRAVGRAHASAQPLPGTGHGAARDAHDPAPGRRRHARGPGARRHAARGERDTGRGKLRWWWLSPGTDPCYAATLKMGSE
jgi:hypothetical protein